MGCRIDACIATLKPEWLACIGKLPPVGQACKLIESDCNVFQRLTLQAGNAAPAWHCCACWA